MFTNVLYSRKEGVFMSIGIGGFCSKLSEDENEITYSYSSYNLNDSNHKNLDKIEDGLIVIHRSALIEPEIHKKINRMPNGRKESVIKRIPNDFPLSDLISEGKICVKNCSNTWKTIDDCDVVAYNICYHLLIEYQIYGRFSENWSYNK